MTMSWSLPQAGLLEARYKEVPPINYKSPSPWAFPSAKKPLGLLGIHRCSVCMRDVEVSTRVSQSGVADQGPGDICYHLPFVCTQFFLGIAESTNSGEGHSQEEIKL